MVSHPCFPDAVPKTVLEAEDFDKDVNPITLLSHLEEVLGRHVVTLESDSLINLSDGPLLEDLQLDISKTDSSLKSSARYVMTFMDTVSMLSQTMCNLRQKITEALQREFVNIVPGDRRMNEDELKSLRISTRVFKDYSDRAAELAALEKLSEEIEGAITHLGQEIIRVREEAEQARLAMEEAEQKMKEEEIRKEKEKKAQEEEAARKAEEERKRREEEERKKKEERRRGAVDDRKKKEEEEQARNPANWSPFVYHVSEDEDSTGTGVGCVLRVPPGSMSKTDITVSVCDQLDSQFHLADNEELVSNIIHIHAEQEFKFQYPPWVAVPNCSPRSQHGRDVVVRISTDGEKWTELPTRDAKIHDMQEVRLIEGSFSSLHTMTVCAISKLKVDHERLTNKGHKLVSSVDLRVSLAIPKGAVRLPSDITLQVQPIDSATVSQVKSQSEAADGLVASSHLVSMNTQARYQKPVTVWMPNPGVSRRPKTSTSVGQKKPTSQQRPSTATDKTKGGTESVVLAWKSGTGDWQHASSVELTHTQDFVSFDIDVLKSPNRLFLLRVKNSMLTDKNIVTTARHVERAAKRKPVNVILRQRSDDMSSIYIEICNSEKTDKLIHTLATRGLDTGPHPSEDVFLTEGQVIEVRFRGNITSDDDHVIRFPYNTHLDTARRQLFVKEVDKFAQHGLDCYRGHVQFYTSPCESDTNNSKGKVSAASAVTEPTLTEQSAADSGPPEPPPLELLTELPITLPKSPIKSQALKRIGVHLEYQGPLTKEYFESLAVDLGDEWRQVAEFLGVTAARVQSITLEHQESGNVEKVIQDVLVCWYKQTTRNSDKVAELYWALRDTGRLDLAEDLLDKNDSFQKQSESRRENEKMLKAFKYVTDSGAALREWKFLARELTLSEADIEEITQKEKVSVREQCFQMLQYWKERFGSKATRRYLAKALKSCELLEPAEKVKQIR